MLVNGGGGVHRGCGSNAHSLRMFWSRPPDPPTPMRGRGGGGGGPGGRCNLTRAAETRRARATSRRPRGWGTRRREISEPINHPALNGRPSTDHHRSLSCCCSNVGFSDRDAFVRRSEQALGAPIPETVTNQLLNGVNQLFGEFDGSFKSKTQLRGRRRARTMPKSSSKRRQDEAGNVAATSASTVRAHAAHLHMDHDQSPEQALLESTAKRPRAHATRQALLEPEHARKLEHSPSRLSEESTRPDLTKQRTFR